MLQSRVLRVLANRLSDQQFVKQPHSIPVSKWQKSKVDKFYRLFILKNPFYKKGFAPNPEVLKAYKWYYDTIFTKRDRLTQELAPYVKKCDVEIVGKQEHEDYIQIRARFRSPMKEVLTKYEKTQILIDYIPDCADTAYFEMVLPRKEFSKVCVQFAGTGDHGYKKRRDNFAIPLIKEYNIGSVIYENAYYGKRKPEGQIRSALGYATDLVALGGYVGFDNQIILEFLKREFGLNNVALTGISLGGHLACIAGCLSPYQTPIVSAMSWSSSSVVWTEGLMSETMGFDGLNKHLETCSETRKIIKQMENEMTQVHLLQKWQGHEDPSQNSPAVFGMRVFGDYFSSFPMLPTPVSPELCKFVVAARDAYYPQIDSCPAVEDCWPGVKVDVKPNHGHVTGYICGNDMFGEALDEVLEKNAKRLKHELGVHSGDFKGLKIIDNPPDDVWVDNKTKFIAFFDPIVVFGISAARSLIKRFL